MFRVMIGALIAALITGSAASQDQAARPYIEQIYDFGHVGIDFNLYHNFAYINHTDKPVRIEDVDVSCDCSTVLPWDSLVPPGDTAVFTLIFNTRDYFGPTNKSFTVYTDDPTATEVKYYYRSIVGQWLEGIKPSIISLFFLPGKESAKVSIPNRMFEEIWLTEVKVFDTTVSVETITDSAKKGQMLEFEVRTHPNLGKGTHYSSLTLKVAKQGAEKPTTCSIPVKTVRY